MLDKRSWKRLEWSMITHRKLHWFEIEEGFCGVVKMLEVSEPFKVGKKQVTICDAGITWVQCAWKGVPLWATAMFDAAGNLFQIYFDIADEVHLEGENSWFVDLIVDVVCEMDGTVSVLDEDELMEALYSKVISESQKTLALDTAEHLVSVLESRFEDVSGWFEKLFKKAQKNL